MHIAAVQLWSGLGPVCSVSVPQFVLFLSAHLASVCSLLFPP